MVTTPEIARGDIVGELELAGWWELANALELPIERWPFVAVEMAYPNGYDQQAVRANAVAQGVVRRDGDSAYADPRVPVALSAALSPDWIVVVSVVGHAGYRLARFFGCTDGVAVFEESIPAGSLALSLMELPDVAQLGDLVLEALPGETQAARSDAAIPFNTPLDAVSATAEEYERLVAAWNSGELSGEDLVRLMAEDPSDRTLVQVTIAGPELGPKMVESVSYWVNGDGGAEVLDVAGESLVWTPFALDGVRALIDRLAVVAGA